MDDADPPKKLSARAFIFGEPLDADAPADGEPCTLPESELNELTKNAHVITAIDAEKILTEPLTPEELQKIFAKLNSAQAAALIEHLRQSAKEAAQYAEIARAAALDAIRRAEPQKPPVDTETMELPLYPAIPQKRHRKNADVSTSNLAKAMTKIENNVPYQLVKKPKERVTVLLTNAKLPPNVRLSFEDCRILDAIGQLWDEGWRIITAQQVYNKIWGNPIDSFVPDEEVKYINGRMALFAVTGFYLTAEDAFFDSNNATPEIKRRLQVKNLLWAEAKGTEEYMEWHLLACPPVYDYSRDLMHQQIEVRPELLHPNTKRRNKNILFSAYYLAIRIDQAARTKKSGRDVILMETAYTEIFGELDVRTRAGRMRYRRFIEDTFPFVLEHFKICGELDAYAIKTRPDGCIVEIKLPAEKITCNTDKKLGE